MYLILDPRSLLPPGEYYIGDPCYVIRDEDWMDCLEETAYFNMLEPGTERKYRPSDLQNGVFSFEDGNEIQYRFAGSSTKYGDGCYPCRENGMQLGECGVDAGLIAAVPVAMVEAVGEPSGLDLGVLHTFEHPFNIGYDDGVISFGHVKVITCDEDEIENY